MAKSTQFDLSFIYTYILYRRLFFLEFTNFMGNKNKTYSDCQAKSVLTPLKLEKQKSLQKTSPLAEYVIYNNHSYRVASKLTA